MPISDKRVLVLIAVLIACMISACGNDKAETNNSETTNTENVSIQTRTIVFPDRFEHLSSMNEEELADYFKDIGVEHYNDLSIEDGLVKLSVTEEQKEYWIEYLAGQIEKQESVLKAVSPKYRAEINEKRDTISVYFDAMMPFDNSFNYVRKTAVYCAMYQLFNGAEDYSISLYVYNLDTGKLVAGGNLEEDDVSYENSDWIISYTLDADEAEKLAASIDSNTEAADYDVIKIKSTFIDGMSVIDILQSAGGNDYRYIYLDENNAVILAVDETQKKAYIENCIRFLTEIKDQFTELGEGYEINWNDEFSELDLKFDANLSKQDQANYLVYSESLCMLTQLLKGDGESFYIDITIYDSSTGEVVSSGNTVDGITWNIGE